MTTMVMNSRCRWPTSVSAVDSRHFLLLLLLLVCCSVISTPLILPTCQAWTTTTTTITKRRARRFTAPTGIVSQHSGGGGVGGGSAGRTRLFSASTSPASADTGAAAGHDPQRSSSSFPSIDHLPSLDTTLRLDHNQDADTPAQYGPLSMTIDELSNELGGRGRALLAWDCYAIGVDPSYYYDDDSYHNNSTATATATTITTSLVAGPEDLSTIANRLPTKRRTQRLGPPSLELLRRRTVRDGSGTTRSRSIENGIATLTHISRSADNTTKLLLRLDDGTEVETVIIPWNGVRSTLCIS